MSSLPQNIKLNRIPQFGTTAPPVGISEEIPTSGCVTVIESTYHQRQVGEPVVVSNSFSRRLKTDEQPYVRELLIGEDWKKLERGWVEEASMVCVVNSEGQFSQVVPSEAELAKLAEKVIEIAFHESEGCKPPRVDLSVPIKESIRMVPACLDNVWLRSKSGKTKAVITVLPL